MLGFGVVGFGQVVSLLGTGITQFAPLIWPWQITGQATALAPVGFFGFFPRIMTSPAGALVDRRNRKLVMIPSDLAARPVTMAVSFLFRSDSLQTWHLYAAATSAGFFRSFQLVDAVRSGSQRWRVRDVANECPVASSRLGSPSVRSSAQRFFRSPICSPAACSSRVCWERAYSREPPPCSSPEATREPAWI